MQCGPALLRHMTDHDPWTHLGTSQTINRLRSIDRFDS